MNRWTKVTDTNFFYKEASMSYIVNRRIGKVKQKARTNRAIYHLEAASGFEPEHKGFADLPLSHLGMPPFCGAGNGIRTRDFNLGKVTLYH